MYFVLRGRVDVLAPGPGPAKDPTSDGEDEKNEKNEEEKNEEEKKRRRDGDGGEDAKVRHGVWHRAVGLGPGACFSAPLQAMHGAECPGGARAVAGGKGLRLLTVPMSIVRRNGSAAVMETCRRETMELIRAVPWLAWIEPAWVRGFVIDSFVLERRGTRRMRGTCGERRRIFQRVAGGAGRPAGARGRGAACDAGGDGRCGDGRRERRRRDRGRSVPRDFARRRPRGFRRLPWMGRTAKKTGMGTGAASPRGRLSSREWTAVTDAVARIAPTECIAMRLDRLRAHSARSAYVARSLERHEGAKALRASLLDRVVRSDDVITDEDLVAMGILADANALCGHVPWRIGAAPVGTPGGPVPDPSSAPAARFDVKRFARRCERVSRVRGRGGRDAGQGDCGDARAVVGTR